MQVSHIYRPSARRWVHPPSLYTGMGRGEDNPTCSKQVVEQLQQVVQQLQAQTEELKQIRRSSATTNQLLAAGHAILQQLLLLVNRISHACSSLAAAAQDYLAAQQAAQQAALLHATLSSGRLLMLLAMTVLALLNVRSSLSRQCMRSPASAWSAAVSTFGSWVGALGAVPQQQKAAGVLWALAAPARSSRCVLAFAGRYGMGFALLLLWTSWARKQQQHRNISTSTGTNYTLHQPISTASSSAAAGAPQAVLGTLAAPLDPLISLLLAAVPAAWSGSGYGHKFFAQLPGWAAVLQAALYEGCVGCVVLKLLSGRWWLWLLLWEGWLGWLCSRFLVRDSISTNSSTTDKESSIMRQSSSSSWYCTGSTKGPVAVAAGGRVESPGLLEAASSRSNTQQVKGEQQVFWVDRLPVRLLTRSKNRAEPDTPVPTTSRGCAGAGTASSTGNMASRSNSVRGSTGELLLRHAGLAVLQLCLPVVLAAGGLWL